MHGMHSMCGFFENAKGQTFIVLLLQGGAQGPGLFFIIPCIDDIRVVDLRTVSFDVPPQEILTKDSVTVAVDAVVYYNIRNPMAAIINVADFGKATKLLSATTLRSDCVTVLRLIRFLESKLIMLLEI